MAKNDNTNSSDQESSKKNQSKLENEIKQQYNKYTCINNAYTQKCIDMSIYRYTYEVKVMMKKQMTAISEWTTPPVCLPTYLQTICYVSSSIFSMLHLSFNPTTSEDRFYPSTFFPLFPSITVSLSDQYLDAQAAAVALKKECKFPVLTSRAK